MLFLIMCMVMMVRMISHGHGHGSHGSHAGQAAGHRADEAERILAKRLAQGEIDIEDYERRLAALESTDDLAEPRRTAMPTGRYSEAAWMAASPDP